MIHALTNWIMALLYNHGALSVFVGVIIESVIIPIPSPLIIMGAGTILVSATLSPLQALVPIMFKIVLPGAVASTIGAFFAYGFCYWGGKSLVDKFHHFIGFDWNDLVAMEKRLSGPKQGWIIFALRALPIMPLSLISAAAGSLRIEPYSFAIWTFLGSIPRCLFLAYLGWFLKDSYVAMAQGLNKLEGVFSALIVVFGAGLVLYLRARVKKNKNG